MPALRNLPYRRIWVAGHRGLVGAALVRHLRDYYPDCEILIAPRDTLDLRRQDETERWIAHNKPDAIILAAAMVGGIGANAARPADFLYDNLAIATNVIHAAAAQNVGKLLFLGSSCIYPRDCAQPITEDALLTGALEPSNEWYAIAKIAGLKLCQAYRRQGGHDFIAAMPCNLYGPGDRFDLEQSHVIPALMMRFDHARRAGDASVSLWGTGRPLREFLYVDDLADALVTLLGHYSGESPVNIGAGTDISIADLAVKIAHVTGYTGRIAWDTSKPDGTPRKIMDSSRMRALGWVPQTDLDDGLAAAWGWFTRTRDQRAA
ncbi:GDP-L-fucose synthase family protein [Micavibrio aeruginosavorus]|uniref:GDP-L-fucose synthase family protein n=1 Tax=Micavibrio aeruginosavorus TaxID=349221 RepID=UPI003F4ADBBF